jgi:hypothetical protein
VIGAEPRKICENDFQHVSQSSAMAETTTTETEEDGPSPPHFLDRYHPCMDLSHVAHVSGSGAAAVLCWLCPPGKQLMQSEIASSFTGHRHCQSLSRQYPSRTARSKSPIPDSEQLQPLEIDTFVDALIESQAHRAKGADKGPDKGLVSIQNTIINTMGPLVRDTLADTRGSERRVFAQEEGGRYANR